jgi:FSR family fosmidomycin resistance protein-like MFS transporter
MTKTNKFTLALLCAGHFINDAYSSTIYPLLPVLGEKLALSTSQVFWLAPLYAISSSLLQPLYGIISDRYARRFFAVFAPTITAVFVSLIGIAPSYGILIVLLLGGGFGIGSFHPQGAAIASNAASDRRRVGMAIFSAVGTLGFALGPLAITRLVATFGLGKSYYAMFVGILMSAVLFKYCPPLERTGKAVEPSRQDGAENRSSNQEPSAPERSAKHHPSAKHLNSSLLAALRGAWQPLLMLYLITVIRSGLQMTTNNYLPFMLKEQGYSLTGTGNALTIFLLLGGVGGLIGGILAEKISGRAVTLFSGIFAAPLMIGAFLTTGVLSLILLGLGGFVLLSTLPVNVAMAQELVPEQTSTVSALMMGAAWGVGALAPQMLRPLAQSHGFRYALIVASALTFLSAVCAYFLPREENIRRQAVETEMAAAAGD